MSDRTFVDTNILVYAHDRSGGRKHEVARDLVRRLWRERSGVLSTQVLQELYVNIRRKAAVPLSAAEAREVLKDYLSWTVVFNDGPAILRATELEQRFGLSFWDALIIQSAHEAGTAVVCSEDLNHGQSYGAVTVVNPFREA
jgi:predicted nucleic acid-binding protein